ncbi:hypothetical protein [Balneatrix alpica]|uniref:Transmembrane protein n=1 Tax=Balneatrix alpica TaxID=75684 RepID=A0ABV5Z6E3_9GAMM|nr:hypothetical protein [Balneatrix alpica]
MVAQSLRGGSIRWSLWAVLAISLVPIVLAQILYFSGWKPEATKEHGHFFNPVIDYSQWLEGDTELNKAWLGRWSLYLSVAGSCDKRCLTRVEEVTQLHLALGREAPRVMRVWADASMAAVEGDPFARIERVNFIDQQVPELSLTVIDPHGNIVINYPLNTEARWILKDLQRLLKLSNIG